MIFFVDLLLHDLLPREHILRELANFLCDIVLCAIFCCVGFVLCVLYVVMSVIVILQARPMSFGFPSS